jgi:hypothetical protein
MCVGGGAQHNKQPKKPDWEARAIFFYERMFSSDTILESWSRIVHTNPALARGNPYQVSSGDKFFWGALMQ